MWQGLGYYSRAQNLHATAKYVAYDLKKFPATYKEILKLKGIGPYTAAAIASICFDEPRPVIDGNVFRFVSRYFGVKADISKSGTRKIFEDLLLEKIPHTSPGTFNQAMMEFGATVCTPRPQCEICLFQASCFVFAKGLQKSFPIKSQKTKVRDRYFHYIVFKSNNHFFINQRKKKDIWRGLFDFYLIEDERDEESMLQKVQERFNLSKMVVADISENIKHILSHQRIYARFYEIDVNSKEIIKLYKSTDLKSYSLKEVFVLPKPKLIINYLQRMNIK